MLLGAHMSIAGGVEKSIQRGIDTGCRAIQIFTKNTNQWRARPLAAEEIRQFKERRDNAGVVVFGHTSYLINLASPNEELRQKSIESFLVEMERCALLGLPYLVTHPGAHLGAGEEIGLARVTRSLDEICARTENASVMILLEITAGQGTVLGGCFEHLAKIMESSSFPEQLGICFDTCHAFASGYDLRSPETYAQVFSRLDSLIGLKHLKVVHLNDSRGGLGSHLDRHEHIGAGRLGLAPFRLLLNDSRLKHLPMVLETPKGNDMQEDIQNLITLKSLVSMEIDGTP